MTTDELREKLLAKPENGFKRLSAEEKAEMESYCRRYMAFMDACKTEREAVTWTVAACRQHGFQPLTAGMALQPGDKVY